MKWLSVLILVVVLVSGVAVHGSQATPIAGRSVAFSQCGASGEDVPSCRSLTGHLALGVEDGPGDTIGVVDTIGSVGTNDIGTAGFGGDATPDRWLQVAQGLLAVAQVVLANWDKFFGGQAALGPIHAAEEVFDPAG